MPAKKETLKALVDLLRRMWLIRAFEEKVSELYAAREIVGLLHLGIGQEAVAVGACSLLRNDDYVFGGHRSHGHAIAKGADINRLMAEIAGRANGYCGGKGGSVHIVAARSRFHYGHRRRWRHDSLSSRCGIRCQGKETTPGCRGLLRRRRRSSRPFSRVA